MKPLSLFVWLIFFLSCHGPSEESEKIITLATPPQARIDSLKDSLIRTAATRQNMPSPDTGVIAGEDSPAMINTGKTTPIELMQFAESLVGVPYVWASTDPRVGFDCSGFITYVFSHFNIRVPRSSIDFTNVGRTIPLENAKRGDIILFTGTNPLETNIGHMGLVMSNNAGILHFIHSSSGRAMGVTMTEMNDQYKKRFIRISRIFIQNG